MFAAQDKAAAVKSAHRGQKACFCFLSAAGASAAAEPQDAGNSRQDGEAFFSVLLFLSFVL